MIKYHYMHYNEHYASAYHNENEMYKILKSTKGDLYSLRLLKSKLMDRIDYFNQYDIFLNQKQLKNIIIDIVESENNK